MVKKKKDLKQKKNKLLFLIKLLILSVFIFFTYKLIPIYYYYFDLRNHINILVNQVDDLSDVELRRNILNKTRDLGISIDLGKIKIIRTDNQSLIRLPYHEDLYIKLLEKEYHLHRFSFLVKVNKKN